MSLKSAAHSAGLRHGIGIGLRSSAARIRANLMECLTEHSAKRQLATIWKGQRETLEMVELGAFKNDPKSAEAVGMTASATLAMLDAPIFDELPLIAADLRRKATADGATWIGRPAQIDVAVAGLTVRGLEVTRSAGVVRVRRGAQAVAKLIEEPTYKASPDEGTVPLRRQPRTLLWVACSLLFVGVITGAATKPIWIAPFVAAAVLAWIAHRVVRARQASRQRIATLAIVADGADGAPYRGGGPARDHVDRAALLESLRAAELAPEGRGNAIRMRAQGSEVELAGLRGRTAKIKELELRYSDSAAAIAVGHALVSAIGPMTITLGADRVEVLSTDGFAAWRAQHDRERAAIGDLVAALDRGRDKSIGKL